MDALDADDVALLVRKTTLPRIQVTAWIAAARLIRRAPFPHEVLYASIRAKNTAALPSLLVRNRGRLRQDLVNAARTNVVSRSVEERADALVSDLVQVAVDISASPDTPGSLGRLLATASDATPEQRRLFIARYFQYEGSIQEFWHALPRSRIQRCGRQRPATQRATRRVHAKPPAAGASLRPVLAQRQHQRGAAAPAASAFPTWLLTKRDWLNLLATDVDGQPVHAGAHCRDDRGRAP